MSEATILRPDRKREMTGWGALSWFLAFFGFMFLVNGIFLWAAISSFPGEDVERSYLTGIDFNGEIARRDRQASSGWTGEIGLVRTGNAARIEARLSTPGGKALEAVSATALLRHPTDRSLDRLISLIPSGAGLFQGSSSGLPSGLWTVVISADVDPDTKGDEFRAQKTVLVE